MKVSVKRSVIILSVLVLLMVPLVFSQSAVFRSFLAELNINNQLPTMVFDPGRSSVLNGVDPLEGTTRLVWFVFNVTDPDGEDNINETSMQFNLTLGTNNEYQANVTCTNISKVPADNKVVFNCSVYLNYFNNASSGWVLNASATDLNDATARNDSERFTYNELSAMQFPVALINFSNLNIGQNDQAADGPLVLNNTGNDDFDEINITASDLVGVDTPSESVGVANFAVNHTNAVAGQGLPLSTSPQAIPDTANGGNLTLPHGGPDSNNGNVSLYFWVDVPGSGLSAQRYNATWNITVVDSN